MAITWHLLFGLVSFAKLHNWHVSLTIQITIIQEILSDINMRNGECECQYYIDKLEYLDDKQRDPLIDNCKILLCHGELRNKSGSVRIMILCLLLLSTCSDVMIHMLFVAYTNKFHSLLMCYFTEAACVPLLWALGSDPTGDPERQELLPGVSTAYSSPWLGSRGPAGWRDSHGGVLQRGFYQWRERSVELQSLCSYSVVLRHFL